MKNDPKNPRCSECGNHLIGVEKLGTRCNACIDKSVKRYRIRTIKAGRRPLQKCGPFVL